MTEPLREEIERVERAAAGLTTLERDVLALSAGRGLALAEIARRLGVSERRTERLLARALRKLDRALQPRRTPWWRPW